MKDGRIVVDFFEDDGTTRISYKFLASQGAIGPGQEYWASFFPGTIDGIYGNQFGGISIEFSPNHRFDGVDNSWVRVCDDKFTYNFDVSGVAYVRQNDAILWENTKKRF